MAQRLVDNTFAGWPHHLESAHCLFNIASDAETYAAKSDEYLGSLLAQLATSTRRIATARYSTYTKDGVTKEVCRDFSETEIREVVTLIDGVLDAAYRKPPRAIGPSEDAPVEFNVTDLPDHLEHLAGTASAQVGNASLRLLPCGFA